MLKNYQNAHSDVLISILMPVKNEESYLEECLNSILNQTIPNWELIIVNDHSTDKSLEILRNYESLDERIKIHINTGKGIIPALQLAFEKSGGNLITRMDGDDVMLSHKLEVLQTQLLEYGIGNMAVGGVKYISNGEVGKGYQEYEQWLNKLTLTGSNFEEIYKECVIPSPAWMLFRSDLEKCGAFNSNLYPEDYDLCFRMYKAGLNVIPSIEIVHIWRDHLGRSSRNLPEYSDNSFLDLKVKYFLEIDFDNQKELVIWGAGKKGKKVAKQLMSNGIHFRWICNNENKIGKEILGVSIESSESLDLNQNRQVIILVANKKDQTNIRTEPLLLSGKTQSFFFC